MPRFRVLFNSYYQGVGPQHPRAQRGLISRPGLERVLDYRRQVEQRVLAVLQSQAHDEALSALVTLGLHHEQQHQELLVTDIKHALSFNPLRPAYGKRWPIAARARTAGALARRARRHGRRSATSRRSTAASCSTTKARAIRAAARLPDRLAPGQLR